MNRRLHLCNLLLHMQQKVVVTGSWPRCAISKSWELPMNRTPSSRPSSPVGEKAPGGRLRGIPTGSWLDSRPNFGGVLSHEPGVGRDSRRAL